MNVVIFDLEFNQAFDFSTGEKTKKNDRIPFEVIQMGAVILDETLHIIDTFSMFVEPAYYCRMHPYVEKITNITMSDLIGKASFSEVFLRFSEFCNVHGEYYLGTWGQTDLPQLFRNMDVHDISLHRLSPKYVNIQKEMSLFLNKPTSKHVGLEKAVTYCEIPQKDGFHDALNDAIYTAKLYKHMKENDHPTPIIQTFDPYQLIQKDKQKAKKKASHKRMSHRHTNKQYKKTRVS